MTCWGMGPNPDSAVLPTVLHSGECQGAQGERGVLSMDRHDLCWTGKQASAVRLPVGPDVECMAECLIKNSWS